MFKEILAASVIGAVGLTASGAHTVGQDARLVPSTGTQKVETTSLRYSDEEVISFFAAAAVVLGAVAAMAGAVVFVLYTPVSTATAYDRQLNALAVAKSLG